MRVSGRYFDRQSVYVWSAEELRENDGIEISRPLPIRAVACINASEVSTEGTIVTTRVDVLSVHVLQTFPTGKSQSYTE